MMPIDSWPDAQIIASKHNILWEDKDKKRPPTKHVPQELSSKPAADTIESVIYDAVTSLIELADKYNMGIEKFVAVVMQSVVARLRQNRGES